jgi:hypothetical protein
MPKLYRKQIITGCIDCPYYGNVNGTMKTARCDHIQGPRRLLTKDEVWNGIFPDECPLEEFE